MSTVAMHLNGLDDEQCKEALTRCCGAHRWVEQMMNKRPFASDEQVFSEAESIWQSLGREDILEAFTHHPKIGANVDELRKKFQKTHTWSSQEQASVQEADEETLQALAQGNRDYEARFGYIFIVCATGKSAQEMLTLLQARIHNEDEKELSIAAGEQQKITKIRLEKLS
ncbi:MAG TPA: OHCU decarboxylase [Myxococcales bacterium]|nr:OHCU decarboxylase [Deltaproteobacteria bacterium]MBU53299.1 OHCU decarboxylase [Deltaproteobacteria bacterium]HAA56533.1 OHCU decarboxylase [Myxococcales bacterium]|tara:strand:+ start:7242 stop:7751 length:510 start_codon:yes stop_codon:yes gene_type:complete